MDLSKIDVEAFKEAYAKRKIANEAYQERIKNTVHKRIETESREVLENEVLNLFEQASYMMYTKYPFWCAAIRAVDVKIDLTCPTCAIAADRKFRGFTLIIGQLYLDEELPMMDRMVILMHELMHIFHGFFFRWQKIMEKHREKKKEGRKDQIFQMCNIAHDLSINSFCYTSCLNGTKSILVDQVAWFPHMLALPTDLTMEEYYEILNMLNEQGAFDKNMMDPFDGIYILGDGEGEESDAKGRKLIPMDEFLESLDPADVEKTEERLKSMTTKAYEDAVRSVGKGTLNIDETIEKLLGRGKRITLKSKLDSLLANSRSSSKTSTFKRKSRRNIAGAPGRKKVYKSDLGVVVDASGSVDGALFKEFCEYVNNMALTERIMWTQCDTQCSKTERWTRKTFVNRTQCGGTDMSPGFAALAELGMKRIICFTDGEFFGDPVIPHTVKEIFWVIPRGGCKSYFKKGTIIEVDPPKAWYER